MLDIMSKIYNHVNKKKFTELIFLDLRKAFDTVSQDILKNYIIMVFVV